MAINKTLIAKRFKKAWPNYQHHHHAQQQINRNLIALLQQQKRSINTILEIGCGNGALTQHLRQHYPQATLDLNDLAPSQAHLKTYNYRKLITDDAENLPFNEQYDLIISASTLQWFQDPKNFLKAINAHLKPNALLLFNTYGEKNLQEIRRLTGQGLPIRTLKQWRNYHPKNQKLLHYSQTITQYHFKSPREILKHLQATGVTATAQMRWNKTTLQQFENNYQKHYQTPQGLPLTYHPLIFLSQKTN